MNTTLALPTQICIAFTFPVLALAQAPYGSHKPLTEPTIFGEGTISGGDFDSHPAFMPDGRSIYFVRSSPNFRFWTIFVSKLENGNWTQPEVAPFSGQYSDADPFITADGKQFYFISKRPVNGQAKTDNDIWIMNKTETGWSEPQHLDPPVNSDADEWYPTLTRDGTIYFGSDRPGGHGKTDLYRARLVKGKYAPAENLGEPVNTAADEYEPFIAPDESFLFFMAGGRPDALGRGDLYVTNRHGEKWSEPQNLGDKINSNGTEYSPKISPDGKYFFWSSTRGLTEAPMEKRLDASAITEKFRSAENGLGDIYQIDLSELHLKGKTERVPIAHSSQDAPKPMQAAVDLAGSHDFDFLIGEWRVHHHRLKPDSQEWVDFEGTCSNRELMDGGANMEEHTLNAPYGAYRAIALRAYDPKTGQWAIWWLDGRYPSGLLDPAVKGRFENGVGTFYSDYMQDGKPMRVRFLWSKITPTSARWEQSLSSDGGKTWAANWIMNFNRDTTNPAQSTAEQSDVHDFDFLRGDWRVHHRFLRVKEDDRKWLDADGTASHRELMDGRANLEEYTINAPSGAYRAVALRSYDPKTKQWAIWWIDGRDPLGALDPPVKGGFDNGVGTFYSDGTIGGKPARTRVIYSHTTPTSARWEQAYSPDTGKTWETNWIMTFTRAK